MDLSTEDMDRLLEAHSRGGMGAVAKLTVSLFLARASGQMEEDVEELRATIDHAWAQEDGLRTNDHAALSRLSALAQEAASLRAKVEQVTGELAALRDMYGAAAEQRAEFSAKVEELQRNRDSADADRVALSTALGTRGSALPECRSAGGIVIKGAVRALRAEVERMKADLVTQHAHRRQFRDRAVSAESRIAAIREIALKVRNVPRGAHETAHPYDRGFGDGWSKRGAVIRSEIDVLESAAPNPSMPSNGSDTMSPAQQHADLQRLTGAVPACVCRLGLGLPCFAARHPCSDTCTHDDAATTGHPERVTERSEAFMETCDHEDSTVYHRGAEAMRATVEQWARECFGDVPPTLKAAIEGAMP